MTLFTFLTRVYLGDVCKYHWGKYKTFDLMTASNVGDGNFCEKVVNVFFQPV